MDYSLFNHPIVVRVGVIIMCNNKYLCVYQDASKFWGFPKGRLNYLESYRVGACRELFEETGVYLLPYMLNFKNMITVKRGNQKHNYFMVKTPVFPNVNIDGYEITNYKWMTLEELKSQNVSFFTEQLLRKML